MPALDALTSSVRPSLVIAVCVPAGGMDSLAQIVDGVPDRAGLALIVVRGAARGGDSRDVALAELPARTLTVRVMAERDRAPLEPDTVYMVAPGAVARVCERELAHELVVEPGRDGGAAGIDALFCSLARAFGRRAAGVILAGWGSEGEAGFEALSAAGGSIVVEDAAGAADRARAAVDSGATPVVVPARAMAAALVRIAELLGPWPGAEDIPDRESYERALADSEATLRGFFDASPIPMCVMELCDDDFIYAVPNTRLAEFFTRPPAEVAGKSGRQLGISEESISRWMGVFRDCERSRGSIMLEYPMMLHGRPGWYMGTISYIGQGSSGRSRFALTAVEITRRKEMEQALRDSEERFRATVVHAPVPVMVHADDGQILAVSNALLEATGYSRDRLRTMGQWLELAYGERAPAMQVMVDDAFAAGRPPPPHELEVRIASGDIRQWLFRVSERQTMADGRVYFIVVSVDVTEQRRVERELRRADQQKDEFLAMLGHELRNPLAAIRSAGHLLEIIEVGDRRLERARHVVERQSAHMARLIDGLLDVSRITRGKLSIEKKTVDLVKLLDQVLSDVADQARSSGLELRHELCADSLWIEGDAVRLTQVIDNLLSNAIKYTDSPGTITIRAGRDSDMAAVSVRDTGVGFEPEFARRVFEPFQQEPQDLARSRGGLGLGLALSRGIVELHGGTIEASSPGRGQGAELVVRVPLAPSR